MHVPARLVSRSGTDLAGRVQNLGEGGAFFVTGDLEAAFGEADEVTLLLHREGRAPVPASGVVLRIDLDYEADDVVRAMAIRFHAPLSGESLRSLGHGTEAE
jgi:hypothetical protein